MLKVNLTTFMSVQLPKDITTPLKIPFSIENFGLYALKIVARCRSGGLLGFRGFRGGEDLRIEIDDIKLREIPPKDTPQYYNIPSAWNGTELKGLAKTIVFLLPLNKGPHTLTCIPNKGAQLESFGFQIIENLREIVFELNEQAEDGDRRPWYTFVFVNLPLLTLTADVSVSWHFLDGDDVKLIIDNKVEENVGSRLWKYWVWSARPWNIFSGAKRELKTFTPGLAKDIHYIELWADKIPTLHRVTLDLGDFQPKRIPTPIDPEWTHDFNDDPEAIIMARLMLGEAETQSAEAKLWVAGSVLNRVASSAWPNTIHDVILQEGQYDPFKSVDTNFRKITDPLGEDTSQLRLKNWQECCDLAEKLLLGRIPNPTTATHFSGEGVDKDYFIKTYIPKGKFLKQIDNTIFYWSPN